MENKREMVNFYHVYQISWYVYWSNPRTQRWELANWSTSQQWMSPKETLELSSQAIRLLKQWVQEVRPAQEFPAGRRKQQQEELVS